MRSPRSMDHVRGLGYNSDQNIRCFWYGSSPDRWLSNVRTHSEPEWLKHNFVYTLHTKEIMPHRIYWLQIEDLATLR
jgi:hypothetical protein